MAVRLIDRLRLDPARERADLIASLRSEAPSIPPKFFYDATGCALFAAICELDEYYPTRTERAIWDRHQQEIARTIGRVRQLVDLGAGDGRKAERWLAPLSATRYVPVDVSRAALAPTVERFAVEHAAIETVGVLADFTAGLEIGDALLREPALFFYPGSSIGNFSPDEALALLEHVRALSAASSGGLLIGVDTKKDRKRLDAAYDDALGVTAAFNRNTLRHVNAVLGCDFDPRAFEHLGFYDEDVGRVEMHLEARSEQRVLVDGEVRVFRKGERILTEHSWKYTPTEFEALLRRAGYSRVRCWQDERGDFAVMHAV